ncbi:MAG TPA: helix-turn-helix domain-containing protein [Verrucomicrobiae bacterium]|nr:helix-turn-helix domain-containing protein [Verrucomicrobiae bacterium]
MNDGDARKTDGGDNGRETETPSRLWKVADVAAYARCSPRTVGNLMVAGLPFIKLGHLVRFEPRAVARWMAGERR